jgi:parvulin-like peptidyl-prolyl isomerase
MRPARRTRGMTGVRTRRCGIPFAAAALLVLASCGRGAWRDEDPSLRPVLRIQDKTLTAADWEAYRQRKLGVEAQQDENELFNLFVERQLYLYLADRDRIDVDDAEVRENLTRAGLGAEDLKSQELIRSVRDDLRIQKWIKATISPSVQVTPKEMEEYYKKNELQFLQPETVQVREILVPDPVEAGKLYRQLRRLPMAEFFQTATRLSKAASAVNGGELGRFQKGDLPEDFEKAIFRLRPGEMSEPVKSDLGYHLFLVEERIQRHQQSFAQARDVIFGILLSEKESRAIQSYMADARGRLNIQVLEKSHKSEGGR